MCCFFVLYLTFIRLLFCKNINKYKDNAHAVWFITVQNVLIVCMSVLCSRCFCAVLSYRLLFCRSV